MVKKKSKLIKVDIPTPLRKRFPRRNPRDPRLPSYKPQPPTGRTCGQSTIIPLEYSPILDAKIPIKKLNLERRTRNMDKVNINKSRSTHYIHIHLFFLTDSVQPKTPDMSQLMKEMTAIHEPPIPPGNCQACWSKVAASLRAV